MRGSVRLFVYGSLMSGLKYSRLLNSAAFQRAAVTRGAYELFDLGPYPAASPGGVEPLRGELYAVDAQTLARVDALEGHPELYRRVERPLEDGSIAWVYEIVLDESSRVTLARAERVEGGDWRARLASRGAT